MQNILKLTYFEMKQMLRYWLTVGLIFIITTFYFVLKFLMRNSQASSPLSPLSLYSNITTTGALLGILAMPIACFIIWYKDWQGSSQMISRWLAAPIKRSDLFWAKKLTLVYYFMLMVALVFLTVYLYHFLFTIFLGNRYLSDMPIHMIFKFNSPFDLFFADHWLISILQILTWISFIAYFFLGILIERAYSWRQGLLYLVFMILLFVGLVTLPSYISHPASWDLYLPFLIINIALGILADWLANDLIMPKIHK